MHASFAPWIVRGAAKPPKSPEQAEVRWKVARGGEFEKEPGETKKGHQVSADCVRKGRVAALREGRDVGSPPREPTEKKKKKNVEALKG